MTPSSRPTQSQSTLSTYYLRRGLSREDNGRAQGDLRTWVFTHCRSCPVLSIWYYLLSWWYYALLQLQLLTLLRSSNSSGSRCFRISSWDLPWRVWRNKPSRNESTCGIEIDWRKSLVQHRWRTSQSEALKGLS